MASSPTVTLSDLNAAPPDIFVALAGPMVEHSIWIAERCAGKRPFASVETLRQALIAEIAALPSEKLDGIFRLHPELAGAEAASGAMTASSTSEQARLGLTSLDPAQALILAEMNAAYSEKFGFPCIIALRLHDSVASVLETFERRLEATLDEARRDNLEQIGEVVRGRLERLVTPQGWLSTHVLDTGGGRPAAGMSIDLLFRRGREWINLKSVRSNADGRTDEPLLRASAMKTGVYRLEFDAGGYFRAQGVTDEAPPFLDRVVLEFGVSDPDAHYHVPLLCTPWSYTTYRGS